MTKSALVGVLENCRFVDLHAHAGDALQRLPVLLRILLENVLRNAGDDSQSAADAILSSIGKGATAAEIPFYPSRVLMHDTTSTPAFVDIAGMREALAEAGGDPSRLNPVLPVDVSVDHSIAVDFFGQPDAFARNMEAEFRRNGARYRFMKWAMQALSGVRIHPPGTGILHTINLERLATVVTTTTCDGERWVFPDTMVGTDSHTPMINGIGVLGWGVGGLEAESVMFGMPMMLRVPDVVGVRLTGSLGPGVFATDLALVVTEKLRRAKLAGRFVEFFGPGVSSLTAGERCVVANMTPEFGASTALFPIDQQTLKYLESIGRPRSHVEMVAEYAQQQGLWFDPDANPKYSDTIEIDLSTVQIGLAGPRRPQDRMSPEHTVDVVRKLIGNRPRKPIEPAAPPDGAVALAAITSCTNTSDPRLLIAAGLLARKARSFGLKPPSWVKTSCAPGSPTAERYLRRSGLLEDLEAIGFGIVAYGCTTCIGNSGPLVPEMRNAIKSGTLAVAVLSGNRNFPGRVHAEIDDAFLASPPLVVAFALAGDIDRNILEDPLGVSQTGRPVRLRDIWPTGAEIDSAVTAAVDPADIARAYENAEANGAWHRLEAPDTPLFPWDEASNDIRRPPFASVDGCPSLGHYIARPLLVLGDDITTDHITPAGEIPLDSDAGRYLVERGENPHDLNVYAARRGNWEVLRRGLFTNRSIVNLLDPSLPAGQTLHVPSGDRMPTWRAAGRYQEEKVPLVIVAGHRYGTGSSRDWAAKGPNLLGVRAVLAASFERIHRTNLIGMGILPLVLPEPLHPGNLALQPADQIEIDADAASLMPRSSVPVTILRASGDKQPFVATAAVETALEISLLIAGGMLPFILKRALNEP